VGVYIPLPTTGAIALGGLVRRAVSRGSTSADAEASPGTLFASGLIAGGALAGLGIALLQGLDAQVLGPDGIVRPVPLVTHWGLALAPRLLGSESAAALAASAVWTITPFLLLALVLAIVGRRRQGGGS